MSLQRDVKHRLIHALCYEVLLLLIGSPLLSLLFKQSLAHSSVLWLMMTLAAIVWNMLFNHYFEKLEQLAGWTRRTLLIRILHAVGFEGGLIVFTVPMIAWMLGLSLIDALLLDIALACGIMFYTFIYQYCYDLISAKYWHL